MSAPALIRCRRGDCRAAIWLGGAGAGWHWRVGAGAREASGACARAQVAVERALDHLYYWAQDDALDRDTSRFRRLIAAVEARAVARGVLYPTVPGRVPAGGDPWP